MVISPVTSYAASGVGAPYLSPAKRAVQSAKAAQPAAPGAAYQVTLSREAQARSLKLEGYSIVLISMKLGLDVTTVKQYLGIAESTGMVAFKSTYVAPKSTYVAPKTTYTEPKTPYTEPKAITQGREQLTGELNQVSLAEFTWSNLMDSITIKRTDNRTA